MKRVSTNLSNIDMQYYLRRKEVEMNRLQNQMGDQTRIKNLRDDPIAAAHATRFRSKLNRLAQFGKNVDNAVQNGRVAEANLASAQEAMHRIRELAIQGGSDVYTKEDKAYMAAEMDQLLNEIVELANARGADGSYLFGGTRTDAQAFRVLRGRVPGADGQVVTGVEYAGTRQNQQVEISENAYINTAYPGNDLFWAEQQSIFSDINADNFVVQQDSEVLIDGVKVQFNQGDNVQSVIARIKDSDAAVDAYLDPVNNSLVVETTTPHQLMMEDVGGGTVLQDLGILAGGGKPPQNYHSEAVVAGGSLFDMVMQLRDSLYKGDTIDIGGKGLKGIDNAMRILNKSRSDIGSVESRLAVTAKRLMSDSTETRALSSMEEDLDITEAMTNLKMLEYSHQAALQTASKILPPTLLDFLR